MSQSIGWLIGVPVLLIIACFPLLLLLAPFFRELSTGALSVFGGVLDSALSVGMYGGIGAQLDELTKNQSIVNI